MKHNAQLVTAMTGMIYGRGISVDGPGLPVMPHTKAQELPYHPTKHDLAALERAQAKRARKSLVKLANVIHANACNPTASSL